MVLLCRMLSLLPVIITGYDTHAHFISNKGPTLQERSVNCSDLGAPANQACWQDLRLADWLTEWKAKTPICTGAQTGSDCCLGYEPWSNCFLRLAHGSPDTVCAEIKLQSCTSAGVLRDLTVGSSIKPQVYYILRTIYCKIVFLTNDKS